MKRILCLFISLLMVISLCSCGNDAKQEPIRTNYANLDRFVLQEKIEDGSDWDAIYMDSKTGVLYFVHHVWSSNGHTIEWCTVLLDSDGLPLLADGYERKN